MYVPNSVFNKLCPGPWSTMKKKNNANTYFIAIVVGMVHYYYLIIFMYLIAQPRKTLYISIPQSLQGDRSRLLIYRRVCVCVHFSVRFYEYVGERDLPAVTHTCVVQVRIIYIPISSAYFFFFIL